MAPNADSQNLSEGKAKRQFGRLLTSPFAFIGRAAISWVNNLGAASIFLLLAFLKIIRPKQVPKIVQQIYYIGARSTMIIMLVSLFTGMVLSLQSYRALANAGAEGALGALVALTLVRELGPVLTAIMIAARAGSAITVEIGIQRISEQIDALDTMRIDSLRYLISPRIAASIISFPLLTAVVFTLEALDAIITSLGHEAAQEAIRSMGVYIDKHFGAIGGFSTRRHTNEFITLLPNSDLTEAESRLKDFVDDFREHGIRGIWAGARKQAASEVCVEFSILAGIAQGQPIVEIDSVIDSAKHQQKEIARLRCDVRR